jgi:hypothetical protein
MRTPGNFSTQELFYTWALEHRRLCFFTGVELTDAELEVDTSRKTIEMRRYSGGVHEVLTPAQTYSTHGGWDEAIMESFVDAIPPGRGDQVLTSAVKPLDSPLMAFAAEAARRTSQAVHLAAFERRARHEQTRGAHLK